MGRTEAWEGFVICGPSVLNVNKTHAHGFRSLSCAFSFFSSYDLQVTYFEEETQKGSQIPIQIHMFRIPMRRHSDPKVPAIAFLSPNVHTCSG